MQPWLQGGPFLEISFVLANKGDRKEFVKEFFNKFGCIPQKFQLKGVDIADVAELFSKGNTDNQASDVIHAIQIPLMITVVVERKSWLYLEEIAPSTIQVNFCFFGGEADVIEWDQKGIRSSDLPHFTDFLRALYDQFEFPVGIVAYEKDCASALYDCQAAWPNVGYTLDHLHGSDIIEHSKDSAIVNVLVNKKRYSFSELVSAVEINKGGVFVKK